MVAQVLVGSDIAGGTQLLATLDQERLPILAAFWRYPTSESDRRSVPDSPVGGFAVVILTAWIAANASVAAGTHSIVASKLRYEGYSRDTCKRRKQAARAATLIEHRSAR
jgi:hypothetical protein